MENAILFAIVVSVASCADGRVYYLENLDGVRNNDAIYPIAEQQASRDLDLAFSAGDPIENIVSPTKKVSELSEILFKTKEYKDHYPRVLPISFFFTLFFCKRNMNSIKRVYRIYSQRSLYSALRVNLSFDNACLRFVRYTPWLHRKSRISS